MNNLQIANTILGQIKATDRMALMAWGAKNFVSLNEKGSQLGGVQFQVNGLKFKGTVIVKLMASDTYTVEIGKLDKKSFQWNSKAVVEDVYCDSLVAHIDQLIER